MTASAKVSPSHREPRDLQRVVCDPSASEGKAAEFGGNQWFKHALEYEFCRNCPRRRDPAFRFRRFSGSKSRGGAWSVETTSSHPVSEFPCSSGYSHPGGRGAPFPHPPGDCRARSLAVGNEVSEQPISLVIDPGGEVERVRYRIQRAGRKAQSPQVRNG
jgi:hypothetical protein